MTSGPSTYLGSYEKNIQRTFCSTPGSYQMRTVAYIRISTGGQGLDRQRLAILDYAHRYGLTVHTFIEAQGSSRHMVAKRSLDSMLEQVQAGDLLLVSELSRLAACRRKASVETSTVC